MKNKNYNIDYHDDRNSENPDVVRARQLEEKAKFEKAKESKDNTSKASETNEKK